MTLDWPIVGVTRLALGCAPDIVFVNFSKFHEKKFKKLTPTKKRMSLKNCPEFVQVTFYFMY